MSTPTGTSGRAPATACSAIAPNGDLIGKVPIPEKVANVVFGGPKRNRLFVCGFTSLYAIFVNTQGAQRP